MSRMYRLLRDHSDLSRDVLDQQQSELPDPEDERELGRRLILGKHITLSAIMEIILKYDLFPKADDILRRMAVIRQNHHSIKPTRHTTRYLLGEDVRPTDQLYLAEIGLTIPIPAPNLRAFREIGTDEKQVTEMAFELASMDQVQEAEMFLVDALEEFPKSMRIKVMLAWHYCRCQQFKQAMEQCHKALKLNPGLFPLVEYLGMAEQALGKHLLAINHFQKLVSLKRVKPIWYLQLAVSLERARLIKDAQHNYQMFLTFNVDPELEKFAEQRLTTLVD